MQSVGLKLDVLRGEGRPLQSRPIGRQASCTVSLLDLESHISLHQHQNYLPSANSTTSSAKRGPSFTAPSAGFCATMLWMPHVHNPPTDNTEDQPEWSFLIPISSRFVESDNGLRPAAESLLSNKSRETFSQLPNSSKSVWIPHLFPFWL